MSMNAADSPSIQAMRHIGKVFGEFDSDSAAMIVLEGDQPLGADAHHFYDDPGPELQQDTKHVQHVQDFWGDPLTAGGSQSKDGKAALVQVYLAGNQGEARSNQSVDAVRDIVADMTPPPGVKAYVTGAAPLITDNFEVGSEGTEKVTAITFLVIAVMLLIVYRSIVTSCHLLFRCWSNCPQPVASSRHWRNAGIIGLSTYSTNLLTLLAIAAGTDYAIFIIGRYHEARDAGEDREAAYHNMFRGTVHVIVGSGLTIAGAVPACTSPGCPTSRRWASRRHRRAGDAGRGTDPRRPPFW